MTGTVKIHYLYNNWGNDISTHRCEAILEWEDCPESEVVVGRGHSYEEAKAQAIDIFRAIPPSETLIVGESSVKPVEVK